LPGSTQKQLKSKVIKLMSQLSTRIDFLAQSLFKKQLSCPHCLSQDLEEVASKYYLIKIKQCNHCKLFFTSPIYQPSLSSELYDRIYSAEGSTTKMPLPEQLTALKEENFKGSDKYFGDRIQALTQYTDGRNLLEIGSSWGYFLYQAKMQGFDVTGIELSDTRRQYGVDNLSVNVLKNISDLGSQKFDLVYTSHTLEHFTDLSTIFAEIATHLEEGGKLILEVPNFDLFSFGSSTLSIIGAIHPIGFASDFFALNLPKYGLQLIGFYDNWEDFPDRKSTRSTGDIILLVAEKITSVNL
jgi:2-polyprenyl-3-methyl-5-hydroxy-6-metoxy-1,4-benzoquinol methylase